MALVLVNYVMQHFGDNLATQDYLHFVFGSGMAVSNNSRKYFYFGQQDHLQDNGDCESPFMLISCIQLVYS